MITYYKIDKCMGLNREQLMRAAKKSGITEYYKESKFLGITNGKQFCYEVLYWDSKLREDYYTKLFVDLDTDEQPIANY